MSGKRIHIEKYDIHAFEKEQKPYTMILTDVIQRIPPERMKEAFLWIFLESLPPTWIPNKQHIMQHFDISAKTYDRWMSWLNTVKLIEYRQERCVGGEFAKGTLIVLSGSRFSPEAESCGTVKIDGSVINKKKGKVIHISEAHRIPKNDCSVGASTTRSSIDESAISPNTQNTEVPSNDAHINTTNKNIKAIRKTKGKPVTVFSDICSVKDHIEKVIANRKAYVEEDMIDQIAFYAHQCADDYDSVVKRINIGLKKVREGKWNIPQGYNGITSQSIREKDEEAARAKQEEYRQNAQAFQAMTNTMAKGEGLRKFSELTKNLREQVYGKSTD